MGPGDPFERSGQPEHQVSWSPLDDVVEAPPQAARASAKVAAPPPAKVAQAPAAVDGRGVWLGVARYGALAGAGLGILGAFGTWRQALIVLGFMLAGALIALLSFGVHTKRLRFKEAWRALWGGEPKGQGPW